MLILVDHFASDQNLRIQKTRLELLQSERVRLVTDAFEADNSVAADAVDKGEDAGQDLDFKLYDEKRGIFDVDAEEAGIEVFWRQCLVGELVRGLQ